ncbi:MAG: DUF3098 domain-containing protein [Bacteroidetes bacterium]|nr:DUF3098 domain-containing protein [Bacteroidota bacterium]
MKPTFTKKNYYILLTGLLLICLGYVLMIGGKSEDPNVFNPEIFNFQRITLAPIMCLVGFVTIIAAIMWRPKNIENDPLKNDSVKNG